MDKGIKTSSFTQKETKPCRNRGRPQRHECERMKTIAWYHFLAGEMSPREMCECWLPLSDLDQATIYRYRRGDISPRQDILEAEDKIFQAARHVYNIGPLEMPLWDALWGSITPSDFRLADRMMPSGDWPKEDTLSKIFFDDVTLARVISFQNTYLFGRSKSHSPGLETLIASIRVCRSWILQGEGNSAALRVLMEGCMSLPDTRELLKRHGLIRPLQNWISSQFRAPKSSKQGFSYWAPWMSDDEEFMQQLVIADERKLQVKNTLLQDLLSYDTSRLGQDEF